MDSAEKSFSTKAAGRPGIRKKGLATRQRIIDVARHILIEEGYEHFILRRVAQEASVKPGNLQYYFGSKKELLAAVLLPEITRYEDIYEQFAERNLGVETVVNEVVDFLLNEIQLKSTTNIWYVVWAQSAHDEDLAEMMEEWYEEYIGSLKRLFKQSVPDLPDRRAGHAASILTAMMDGLTNQIGHGRRQLTMHQNIDRSVKDSLLALLKI
jgi:AcrR family transcriptional regulator